MPSLNVFNNDVAQASLAPPAFVPERYAELWWYSGASVSTTSTATSYLQKGSTATTTTVGVPQSKLYTLNSNWPASTKFALEVSAWSSVSSCTGDVALWDFTSNSQAGVGLSFSSTTASVLRSNTFTLTPGHTYGVALYVLSGSGTVYLTDASLIIFS